MFDVLKDSNDKFNKKNILPLIGASIACVTMALFVVESTNEYLANSSKYDSSSSVFEKHSHVREWMDQAHKDFLSTHIPRTIIGLSTLSILIYFSIDNIRKNKQIENLIANSEPSSRICNVLVSDISEEQSVV